MNTISIIIPVYNEENCLKKLIVELDNVKKKLDQTYNTEYIFIDDGSTDQSFNLLENLSINNKHIKIIRFSRNFGHQVAVSAGLKNCSSDFAVLIDADLQDPPMLIFEMIDKLKEGYDVVSARRNKRQGETKFKIFTASLFYKIFNKLIDTKIPEDTGDFRIISKKVINNFKNLNEKNKFIRALIPWLGFKSTQISYDRNERFFGKTKYPISKMIRLALNASISFSTKIINYMVILSFAIILASFSYGAYLLIFKKIIMNEIIPGFSAIFLSIIFFSGLILFFLSIIGLYIARIFDEVKNRPEYIIEKKINLN